MANNHSMLNLLCYELPGYLTRPMYLEYENRKVQINKIWDQNYKEYLPLKKYSHVVDMLLALCIFNRYVLGSMNGASDFYMYLNKSSGNNDCEIRCGNYKLNKEQYNKMLSVIMSFKDIKDKYQLNDIFFEFSDTLEFLRNCKNLLYIPENNSDNQRLNHEEDYPF